MKEILWDDAVELGSPYLYVLAVTLNPKEEPNIIGLAWWTFVSWEPKMIAISIGINRYSKKCLDYCKEFVLCFPSKEQAHGAWLCGQLSGETTNKFKEGEFTKISSKIVRPPIIKGVTVAYECKVVNSVIAGDHIIYIGEVMAIHGTPSKQMHLYSIHYKKLIGIDYEGNVQHLKTPVPSDS